VFRHLRLRGVGGAILWGYRQAATLRTWTIRKDADDRWTLRATLERAEPFQLRQTPLLFSAPRAGGYWAWGLDAAPQIHDGQLVAKLGPPEQ
jgi:hypothetical protein